MGKLKKCVMLLLALMLVFTAFGAALPALALDDAPTQGDGVLGDGEQGTGGEQGDGGEQGTGGEQGDGGEQGTGTESGEDGEILEGLLLGVSAGKGEIGGFTFNPDTGEMRGTNDKNGELKDEIDKAFKKAGQNKPYNYGLIKTLIISGKLNSDDFGFIKSKMAGALEGLDISGVKNSALPKGAFAGFTALKSARLWNNIELSDDAFKGCVSLVKVNSNSCVDLSNVKFGGDDDRERDGRGYDNDDGRGNGNGNNHGNGYGNNAGNGKGAFAYCSAIEKVILPKKDAKLPKEMFLWCTSLDELINWPSGNSYGNDKSNDKANNKDNDNNKGNNNNYGDDCLKGCAFDFSAGYPAGTGWIDKDAKKYASWQTPKLIISLASAEDSASIVQDDAFTEPGWIVKTNKGVDYTDILKNITQYAAWLNQTLKVTTGYMFDGVAATGIDTSKVGVYVITYTLSGNMGPQCTSTVLGSVSYTLTVTPKQGNIIPGIIPGGMLGQQEVTEILETEPPMGELDAEELPRTGEADQFALFILGAGMLAAGAVILTKRLRAQ